jgi:hypothetical protein
VNWLQRLTRWLAAEPAVILYAISAGVTAWAAFGFRTPAHGVAAVEMIGAALVTLITAFATRPVSVPIVTGAVSELATAASAFGLHMTAAQIGALTPVVSIVVALLLRQAITPVVSMKKRPVINLMKDQAAS